MTDSQGPRAVEMKAKLCRECDFYHRYPSHLHPFPMIKEKSVKTRFSTLHWPRNVLMLRRRLDLQQSGRMSTRTKAKKRRKSSMVDNRMLSTAVLSQEMEYRFEIIQPSSNPRVQHHISPPSHQSWFLSWLIELQQRNVNCYWNNALKTISRKTSQVINNIDSNIILIYNKWISRWTIFIHLQT